MTMSQHKSTTKQCYYQATGSVAHERLSPLVPSDWKDIQKQKSSSTAGNDNNDPIVPDFLWENAPRHETKGYRDDVKVYSHLPNGSNILDSKWVLARLFANHHYYESERRKKDSDDDENDASEDQAPSSLLATLETKCFRGLDGFQSFVEEAQLTTADTTTPPPAQQHPVFPDIAQPTEMDLSQAPFPDPPHNLWVVKDAMSNGAGGVWVVGPENVQTFLSSSSTTLSSLATSPLYPEHRYVAQRYVWPPILFDGRKCHVRVYGLFTSDGRAFCHRRAFLHVANDRFSTTTTTTASGGSTTFQDSIHITNCCANSHDDSKFAGEILADFESTTPKTVDGPLEIPLALFFPSVCASVAALAQQSFPLLQGGDAHHGFEYLGMDFMLSYNAHRQPVAYLLEVNAPPSQDTATGLPHAETVHNDVLTDLLNLWVRPHIEGRMEQAGGWRCVYNTTDKEEKQQEGPNQTQSQQEEQERGAPIVPSKATILNKIRWAMFEKKMKKRDAAAKEQSAVGGGEDDTKQSDGTATKYIDEKHIRRFTNIARSQFPYFCASPPQQVFFENAGGSQVASQVIDAMVSSLAHRHRNDVGTKTKAAARECFRTLLGAVPGQPVMLGLNATCLLATLAGLYTKHGLLSAGDEIVLSTENHQANFDPWMQAAKRIDGLVVKLWTPFSSDKDIREGIFPSSHNLQDLVTTQTRLVTMPHASNVIGQLRDIQTLSALAKRMSNGRAHVVVDGVAAVSHSYTGLQQLPAVDWYVVSCHKWFGPHLGGLCGREDGAFRELEDAAAVSCSSGSDDYESMYKLFESGTQNYEACAGVVGIGNYYKVLAGHKDTLLERDGDEEVLHSTSHGAEAGDTSMERTAGHPSHHSLQLHLKSHNLVSPCEVQQTYECIRIVEDRLVSQLLHGLKRSPRVRIVEGDSQRLPCLLRLPTMSLVHDVFTGQELYEHCKNHGVVCRCSLFLCTQQLANDFGLTYNDETFFRISLTHYNTVEEVRNLLGILQLLDQW